MSNVMKLIGIILTGLLLAACEETMDDQIAKLASFVEKHRVGGGRDVWLEQQGPYSGKWDKVVLIVGIGDDRRFCDQIIEFFQPINGVTYRCVWAN